VLHSEDHAFGYGFDQMNSSSQRSQRGSSPTRHLSVLLVCLKEALCHLGRQVFGRVLQTLPGEAIQVRFDESDDAALI